MTDKEVEKDIQIVSCPDPTIIKDCSDCVQKGLATCGWAKEQEYQLNINKKVVNTH